MNRSMRLFSILTLSTLLSFGTMQISDAAPTPKVKKVLKKEKAVKKRIVRKGGKKKVRTVKRKSAVKLKKTARKRKRVRKSLQAWLNKMKKRVARSHAKHNQIVAVGAVRGNRANDSAPLYWKGKEANGPVDLPELQAFEVALNQALNGKNNEALSNLNAFVKKYPKSPLVADANHTIDMINKSNEQKKQEQK